LDDLTILFILELLYFGLDRNFFIIVNFFSVSWVYNNIQIIPFCFLCWILKKPKNLPVKRHKSVIKFNIIVEMLYFNKAYRL
jgi:hypothetical protein